MPITDLDGSLHGSHNEFLLLDLKCTHCNWIITWSAKPFHKEVTGLHPRRGMRTPFHSVAQE